MVRSLASWTNLSSGRKRNADPSAAAPLMSGRLHWPRAHARCGRTATVRRRAIGAVALLHMGGAAGRLGDPACSFTHTAAATPTPHTAPCFRRSRYTTLRRRTAPRCPLIAHHARDSSPRPVTHVSVRRPRRPPRALSRPRRVRRPGRAPGGPVAPARHARAWPRWPRSRLRGRRRGATTLAGSARRG